MQLLALPFKPALERLRNSTLWNAEAVARSPKPCWRRMARPPALHKGQLSTGIVQAVLRLRVLLGFDALGQVVW